MSWMNPTIHNAMNQVYGAIPQHLLAAAFAPLPQQAAPSAFAGLQGFLPQQQPLDFLQTGLQSGLWGGAGVAAEPATAAPESIEASEALAQLELPEGVDANMLQALGINLGDTAGATSTNTHESAMAWLDNSLNNVVQMSAPFWNQI